MDAITLLKEDHKSRRAAKGSPKARHTARSVELRASDSADKATAATTRAKRVGKATASAAKRNADKVASTAKRGAKATATSARSGAESAARSAKASVSSSR